jgi:hypothetical protein
MRRVLLVITVVTMLSVPLSVAVSTPAGAFTVLLSCSKVRGNVNATVSFTGTKCTPNPPNGYGNLTGQQLLSPAAFSWANGDAVELQADGPPTTGGTSCAKKWTENLVYGSVEGTSGDPYDQMLAGSDFMIAVCVKNSNGKVKAIRGASFAIEFSQA